MLAVSDLEIVKQLDGVPFEGDVYQIKSMTFVYEVRKDSI